MPSDLEAAKSERDRLSSDVSSWQNKYNTLVNSYDNLDADKKRLEDKLDSMQDNISKSKRSFLHLFNSNFSNDTRRLYTRNRKRPLQYKEKRS